MTCSTTNHLRRFLLAGAAILALAPLAAHAATDTAMRFDIESEDLGKALTEFGQQSEREIVFSADAARGKRAPALHGKLTPNEALDRLLAGTGMTYRANAAGSIIVEGGGDPAPSHPLKLGDAGGASPSAEEEIVVTAHKRGEEKLLDVPIPVGVIKVDEAVEQDQLLLRDYFSKVPGLILTPGYVGAQALTIRGIGVVGFDNPTVSITIDDVPFGASVGADAAWLIPDLDPSDLARIEVLRGPQGALYGSDSMGGLIRYVTKDPSTGQFSGRIQMGTRSVYNGPEPGFDVRGSVNVPVTDELAVRASVFRSQTPGYIDDVRSGRRGINKIESEGGRFTALWKPTDGTSLKFTAFYQHTQEDGSEEAIVGPGLRDLQENYIPGTSASTTTTQGYSLTINTKFGPFDVASITGYSHVTDVRSLDFSVAFGPLAQSVYGPAADGSNYSGPSYVDKVSEELRVSGRLWDDLSYTIGGFYTDESFASASNATAQDLATGQIIDPLFYIAYNLGSFTYDEYAGFANATYNVTDRFDIEFGGRVTHYLSKSPVQIQAGPFALNFLGGNPSIAPAFSSTGTIETYLFTPKFQVTKDLMVYARFASGYRPGTSNPPGPGIPPQANPDETRTYEVGAKGKVFDGLLTIDTSVYYIEWQNIQFQTRDPTGSYPYEANGSGARSDGIELSLASRPWGGLSISAWFVYDDAVLSDAFPAAAPAVGRAGARLPAVPKYSANLSVDQDFPLPAGLVGFVGGAVDYIGDRVGPFVGSEVRQNYPAYAKLDLHLGARSDSWEFTGYVTNATDSRAVLSGGIGYFNPVARQYITPRTFGITVSNSF